jgi:hypothetical protein
MNKKLFVAILILVFTTILILSIVIAAGDAAATPKEMNYGKCVSQRAKDQNNCFKEAQRNFNNQSQMLRKISRNQSANKTEIKEKLKDLRELYKNETDNCKNVYKSEKELCKQYKCKTNELFNMTSFKCYKNQTNSTNLIDNNSTIPEPDKHYCDANSTRADKKFCATFYDPVCGHYNSNKPGDNKQYQITYSNSCFACRDQKIGFWTQGRCNSK